MIAREPLPAAPSAQFRRRALVERAGEWFRGAPIAGGARGWLKHAYHAALMLQSGGRGLACTLPGGEVVRALPRHRHLSWNATEYEAFRAAATLGMTALDVGANVGAYAMLLGQWAGASGRVYAFEPAPAVFDGLSRHIALNGLESIVTPVACAVGSEVADAPLVLAETMGESRLGSSADADEPTIDVRVTTIDRFCEERRLSPAFIKVDVEGWELAVLRGARETIRRAGRRLALFVEMHPSAWPLLGTGTDELLAELAAQSLEIVPLSPTHDVWSLEGLSVRLQHR